MKTETILVTALAIFIVYKHLQVSRGQVPAPISGPKPPDGNPAPSVTNPADVAGQTATVLNVGQQIPTGGQVLSVGTGTPVSYNGSVLAAGSLVRLPDNSVVTVGAAPPLPTTTQQLSTPGGIVQQSLQQTAQQYNTQPGVTWVPVMSNSANGPITILVPFDAQGNNVSGVYGTITPA